MSTARREASSRAIRGDDESVDELMDNLSRDGGWESVARNGGFLESQVETDQGARPEEMIAPDVIFPDDGDASR